MPDAFVRSIRKPRTPLSGPVRSLSIVAASRSRNFSNSVALPAGRCAARSIGVAVGMICYSAFRQVIRFKLQRWAGSCAEPLEREWRPILPPHAPLVWRDLAARQLAPYSSQISLRPARPGDLAAKRSLATTEQLAPSISRILLGSLFYWRSISPRASPLGRALRHKGGMLAGCRRSEGPET